MIKSLIFDFAGVVGADGYWVWLRETVPDLERHREAFHEISVRADRAEISPADFLNFVSARTGVAPETVLRECNPRATLSLLLGAVARRKVPVGCRR